MIFLLCSRMSACHLDHPLLRACALAHLREVRDNAHHLRLFLTNHIQVGDLPPIMDHIKDQENVVVEAATEFKKRKFQDRTPKKNIYVLASYILEGYIHSKPVLYILFEFIQARFVMRSHDLNCYF